MKYSLAALAFVAAALPMPPAHAACTVTVASFSFSPSPETVAPGASVTWCWTGDNHSVTSDTAGVFDSHPTACPPTCGNTGDDFTHVFAQPGTFDYHCKVHSGMTGRIVVAQPAPSKSASPTPKPATKSPTPTPARTTPAPVLTTPPTRFPTPTPTAPTTAPPTTAPPATTTTPPASPSTTPAAVEIDPAPAKPKTGLAIALGLLVAAGALGGAAWLLLRGRTG